MGVHVFPILNPPPTSLPVPSLWVIPLYPWAPCLMHWTRTGDLFHIYMFQCYCLKSSHPRLLPQSPKDCSIHLCLFCCLAYRVIVTIFLNSIYMHWQRNQRSNCQHLLDHGKSKRVPEKTSISALLTMPKPLIVWITINCRKFWKRWEYWTTWSASWEICM